MYGGLNIYVMVKHQHTYSTIQETPILRTRSIKLVIS